MTQTQCTYCNRSLRIEVISPLPNFKYKISSRNVTTKYGGKFCCTYCSVEYIKGVESMLGRYKHCSKYIKQIQDWWRKFKRFNTLDCL